MNITPELYNNSNYLQQRDGKRLIQRIINDIGDEHFETILDIGCGSGNLTNEINIKLSHNEVIALDISESMIEFAKNHYKDQSVKYLTADICEDWQTLQNNLSLGKESVDLVISIYCLHWVSDINQAMDNMTKLLKPGGRCYILLFSWSDLLPIQQKMTLMSKWKRYFLKSEINGLNSSVIDEECDSELVPFPVSDQPNEQQLLIKWQQICINSNLQLPEIVLTHTYYPFNNIKQFQNELEALCHFLPYIPEDRKSEFLTEYFELIDEEYVAKQFEDKEYSDESIVKLNYDYITVVANKKI